MLYVLSPREVGKYVQPSVSRFEALTVIIFTDEGRITFPNWRNNFLDTRVTEDPVSTRAVHLTPAKLTLMNKELFTLFTIAMLDSIFSELGLWSPETYPADRFPACVVKFD